MKQDQSNSFDACVTSYAAEPVRVKRLVETAQVGKAHRFILAWHAPRGVGKSTLLQAIWVKFKQMLLCSLVRLRSFQAMDRESALCELLINIIRDIACQLPTEIARSLPNYIAMTSRSDLAAVLLGLVQDAVANGTPLLILLDDYDVLTEETRQWFESEVLSPLGRTQRAVVVLTSEYEVQFRDTFDLRMRYESYELAGLTQEMIGCAFPAYAALAPEIHRLTGGLPGLVEALVTQLSTLGIKDMQDFQRCRDAVLRTYYNTSVSEAISRYIQPDIQETLLVLSPLRRFEPKMLGHVLSTVLTTQYASYTLFDYLDLIEELGCWAKWDPQRAGYAVTEAYRVVLDGYLRFSSPDLYRTIHDSAFALYHDALRMGYQEYYVIELLYHRLALVLSELGMLSPAEARDRIVVAEFLTGTNGDSVVWIKEDQVASLYIALLQDPDLADYFSAEQIRAILRKLLEKTEIIPQFDQLLLDSAGTFSPN